MLKGAGNGVRKSEVGEDSSIVGDEEFRDVAFLRLELDFPAGSNLPDREALEERTNERSITV